MKDLNSIVVTKSDLISAFAFRAYYTFNSLCKEFNIPLDHPSRESFLEDLYHISAINREFNK